MDVIIRGLIPFFISLIWMKGLTDGSDVTQTDMLWKHAGENATMSCSHTKGSGYYQMYWYRQLKGETMKQIVFTTTTNKDHDFGDFSREKYSATKPDAESGRLYNDPAYFGQGTKLTVLEPGHDVTEPTVKVFLPSEKECQEEEKVKTIVCVARDFYPDHVGVSWTVNGENVTVGVATDSAALRQDKTYTITSRLRVRFTEDKQFNCTVSFFNGTHTELYSRSIRGKKELRGPLTREKYLRITQTAKLSYGAFIIKSSVYGAFVTFLVWKLQSSAGKQSN